MKKHLPLLAGLILATAVNLYLRSYIIYFPQLKTLAHNIISQRVEQTAVQIIQKKFPQFDPLAKDRLLKSLASDYRRQNRSALKKQEHDIYMQLKDRYQDEKGQTYLLELDCWHWARYVENVYRLGHPGDQTVYGSQLDLFMLAPSGFYIHGDQFLFYLSAALYKAFSVFKQVPLFTFLFYLPLLFAAAFIAALYLFSYRLGGWIGATVASLFLGLSPIFLQRSCAGWFDKDILNLLFPLLVVWTYLAAATSAGLSRRVLWVLASAFWLGVFCFTWTHWWFVLFIVLMYEAFSVTHILCMRYFFKRESRGQLRLHFLSTGLFLFFGAFWIMLLAGKQPLVELYEQIRLALILNKPLMSSIWPNVYSTVGELRSLRPAEIAQSSGNIYIFSLAGISLAAMLFQAFYKEEYAGFRRESAVLLVIWFIAMVFASTRGVRFLVFLLLPLSIALGWAIYEVFEYFIKKRSILFILLTAVLLVTGAGFTLQRAHNTARSIYPLIDDTWYKVLTMVREKTPEDTILNSWWDFGDWFKVIGRRRVIFDGQSQDTPQAYWMAKAILSTDEEKAVAILRMLNNGGNRAFEIINAHLKDQLQSVLLLENLLGKEPQEAQRLLLENIPVLAAEEVMRLLYYKPARACFVAESTMLPKMGAISYLGNWDFSKVYIAQNLNTQEKERILERLRKLGRDPRQMQTFYQESFLISRDNLDAWLSKRVLFYSGLVSGWEKEGVVFFENGFVYNPKEKNVVSGAGQVPRSLFVLEDNSLLEIPQQKANVVFSALVFKKDEQYKCLLLDRELAASLMVRLYCFNGLGMKHFVPFIDVEDGNNYIRIFNILW